MKTKMYDVFFGGQWAGQYLADSETQAIQVAWSYHCGQSYHDPKETPKFPVPYHNSHVNVVS